MDGQAQEKLGEACQAVADLAAAAGAWVSDPANGDLVGAEAKSLVHEIGRAGRRARRLARAARSRMSVSVFGPSQAGKSFLVSVLARPGTAPLTADYPGPGGQLDYIREINPEGEGESTGLVTRFTMERYAAPDGYPVKLTLLSESDLARVLINSFFMDGDRSEPPPDGAALSAHIDLYRARCGPVRPGLDGDDIRDVAEYVRSTFAREAYAGALNSFWEEAAVIAPGLDADDRAAFLAPLWGGHAPFSELYARLAKALATLGHAEEVFAGLDALRPRETSIIDVKTLAGAADGEPLRIATADGRAVALARSVVCALAAELVLPMRDLPSDMFAQTDLLDFPGARNRFEQDLQVAFATSAAILPELLLRGKVAYLFDRYVQNQEITSMLLCIPDSNMETVDLPGLVQGWIATTHGPTAQARAGVDTVLFLVLTKFDKHLGDSAAEGGDETRFERRMQASLLEKFGRGGDPWVAQWTPGRPFDNCFWLRNPNFYVDGLIDYDEAKREVRLRPEKAARLAELRAGCLQAPSVRRHFADPQAAWDAALTLNDGGVTYLTEALARVCRPDSKLRQIGAQIDRIAADLAQSVAPYHVADDIGTRLAEKKAAALRVIDDLEETLMRHRFGALLAALTVDQDEVEARLSRVPSSVRITNAVSAATGAPEASAIPRPGRPARPGQSRPGDPERGIRTMTLEQFQARTAVETWIERLKALRDDPDRRAFGLGDGAAADLVAELIHAARRTGLAADMAAALERIGFGLTVERQAPPAAILGAERINGFVATLGMQDLPEAARPQVPTPDGGTRPVFSARAGSDSVDDLPEPPRATATEMWSDWVFALEALFEANARDGLGGDIDIDQNLALGRILAGLKGRPDA
jgi:hypothetical protein